MPELPGPPEEYDEQQRRAWLQGAATVSQLQSDQWAILAQRYREAAEGDEEQDPDTDAGDDDDDTCPECGGTIVESFGGDVCATCNYEVPDDD